MEELERIERERLIYTCNCGWLDLSHMDDSSDECFKGPRNLWQQICHGDSVPEAQNETTMPILAEKAGYRDGCAGSERAFPEEFRKVRHALKGWLFTDFSGQEGGPYLKLPGF